jgi:hypothetical protein
MIHVFIIGYIFLGYVRTNVYSNRTNVYSNDTYKKLFHFPREPINAQYIREGKCDIVRERHELKKIGAVIFYLSL